MKLIQIYRDTRGTAVIEFGLTAPIYFFMIFAIIMGGLLFWMQIGLQHGSEMAARCASVDKVLCNSATAIQSYASSQAFGFNPPPETFTVSTQSCGNQIVASYKLFFVTSLLGKESLTLDARSCFPK
jgi:hypothetical protein